MFSFQSPVRSLTLSFFSFFSFQTFRPKLSVPRKIGSAYVIVCVCVFFYMYMYIGIGFSFVWSFIRLFVRSCARSLVRHESFEIKLHSTAFGCMATRARSFPFFIRHMRVVHIIHILRRRTNDHNVNPFAVRTYGGARLCEHKFVRNEFGLAAYGVRVSVCECICAGPNSILSNPKRERECPNAFFACNQWRKKILCMPFALVD